MKVKESIARYAKLELDPVCMSACQDYSHWQSPCNWFYVCENYVLYSQIMPHNSAVRLQWSCCLSFKCFSYSGQCRYLIRKHSTLTELLCWRFLLLTWGRFEEKETQLFLPKRCVLIMNDYIVCEAAYWCSFVEKQLCLRYLMLSLHWSYWCH